MMGFLPMIYLCRFLVEKAPDVFFGGGRHACPGRRFAVIMMEVFVEQVMLQVSLR